MTRRFWKVSEEIYLKNNYGKLKTSEIAKKLNRSYHSVVRKAYHLGITNQSLSWTVGELDFLRDNYGLMTARELADHLGRSYESVTNAIHKHEIKRIVV